MWCALSVRLVDFASLSIKGVKRQDKREVVEAMIDLIGLREAADRASGALSGGMKRKLSVGLALIGDSKIIFLVSLLN